MSKVYVIMGVSGVGKTTVGSVLAKALDLPFFDGDDFHPEANISKMKAGVSLTDVDRLPWLKDLAYQIKVWLSAKGAVLACSALKEDYRTILKVSDEVEFIFLNGPFELIEDRMKKRSHFMAADMLKSQFRDLEIPPYGMHISVDETPERIVSNILKDINAVNLSDIGVFGLGVMGKSLALNILDKGYAVSVYNRSEEGEAQIVSDFVQMHKNEKLAGFQELEGFINSLGRPRKVLLMVSADVVDLVLSQLIPLLERDDIVIDGGNSYFRETERRQEKLNAEGIHFIGTGVSGGKKGARSGSSLMPGGSRQAYENVRQILEDIAAKDQNGQPCCTNIGTNGSGHFTKMIHNGIEYGEMQLLAEVYSILKPVKTQVQIIEILEQWMSTEASSFLLDATIKVLKKKENDNYLIDLILDKAGHKGTGSWSNIEALKLGVNCSIMNAALFARFDASLKEARVGYSGRLNEVKDQLDQRVDPDQLFLAYQAARILNHHQGFEILRAASIQYKWDLNLSEIARIWTNGSIIKSNLILTCNVTLKSSKSLLDDDALFKQVYHHLKAMVHILTIAMSNNLSTPCFAMAYQYAVALVSEKLPANLIQAQRDFFGAHGYQKLNDPSGQLNHTNWEGHD